MFTNLVSELKHKGISTKAVAGLIGCSESSVLNKVKGATEFTLSEVLLINDNLFPEYKLEYLFERDHKTDSRPA